MNEEIGTEAAQFPEKLVRNKAYKISLQFVRFLLTTLLSVSCALVLNLALAPS
jgi:hypothetical protein